MGKRSTTIAAATALLIACPESHAIPISGSSIGAAIDDLNIIARVQHFFDNKRYCFTREGWHGPGWYMCGYENRPRLGWGGPPGWRLWEVPDGAGGGHGGGMGGGHGTGGGGRIIKGGGHRGGSGGGSHGASAQAQHSKFPTHGGMHGKGRHPHTPGMGGMSHRGGGHHHGRR